MIKTQLLKAIAILLCATVCVGHNYATNNPDIYPYQSLNDAFKAAHFDPAKKGSSFIVMTTDTHYGRCDAEGMKYIIQDVNSMPVKPAFFLVNGDLANDASVTFGVNPTKEQQALAKEQFKLFKADADLLDKSVPVKLILGNHDTHPRKLDPDIFWSVFPGYPPYSSMDQEGIHVIFLHGHGNGTQDEPQLDWLMNDVKLIPRDQTVLIFIHQPSMMRRVRERKIPEAISKVFENHTGMIWLVGGHEHYNKQTAFRLKNTTMVEQWMVNGTSGVWGGPDRPGYWIYCLENGQVKARIYKQKTEGYRLEEMPDLTAAKPVPVPFDNCPGIVWKVMVGEGDYPYLLEADGADCINYWSGVKSIIYSLPLEKAQNKARHIALLSDALDENKAKPGQYFVSRDARQWTEVPLKDSKEDLLIIEIPSLMQKDRKMYVKFVPAGVAAIAGIALTE